MTRGHWRRALLAAAALPLVMTAGCGSGADDGTADDRRSPRVQATASANGTQNDTTPPTEADEAEVRALLDKIRAAWGAGDATAYASHHTPDADLIDFAGNHAQGREEIVALLQPLFDGVLEGTRVNARITDFRFLTPDVAIFHTKGRIAPTGETSIQTFVSTREAGRWLIAAFQNTRIQPEQAQ